MMRGCIEDTNIFPFHVHMYNICISLLFPDGGVRHGSVPQTATMSDFPDTLPSFEKAKERPEPASVKFDSKAVTEQAVS